MCTHHMQDTGQASPLSLDQLLALMDPTDVVSPVWFFTLTQRWTFIYIQVMKVSGHFEGKVTLVEGNRREGTEREVMGGGGVRAVFRPSNKVLLSSCFFCLEGQETRPSETQASGS